MMNNIDDIINSFDGMKRAEARPFMYTRIMVRMQQDDASIWSRLSSFIAKPVVAFCCLFTIIGANIYFIANNSSNKTEEVTTASNSAADILQNENYILAVNTNFDAPNQ